MRERTIEQIVHAPLPLTQEQIAEQIENSPVPQIAVVPVIEHVVDDVHNKIQQLLLMTERIGKHCEVAETAVGSLPPLDELVLLAKRAIEPLPHPREAVPWKRRQIIPLPRIQRKGRTCDKV